MRVAIEIDGLVLEMCGSEKFEEIGVNCCLMCDCTGGGKASHLCKVINEMHGVCRFMSNLTKTKGYHWKIRN